MLIRSQTHGATVESNFRGNISNAILPGSSPDLALEKGANNLSFFTDSSSVAAQAWWPITLQLVSDLVLR